MLMSMAPYGSSRAMPKLGAKQCLLFNSHFALYLALDVGIFGLHKLVILSSIDSFIHSLKMLILLDKKIDYDIGGPNISWTSVKSSAFDQYNMISRQW